MKKGKLLLLLVIILSLILTMTVVGCKPEEEPPVEEPPINTVDLDEVITKTAPAVVYPEYDGADTLVVGYSYFSNKFSPFFSKTAYDQDVASMTQVGLLTTDRQGAVIMNGIDGETNNYNGTDYLYKGIADFDVTQNTDGTVYYDIEIRDDLFFSDGVHLTIDDVIFSMYVLSDPSYDGSSSFYAQPIKGMTEYRTGVTSDVYDIYATKADAILAADYEGAVTEAFTEAEQTTYWGAAFDAAGLKFTQEIIDYVNKTYNNATYAAYMGAYDNQDITGSEALQVAFGMRMWGFGSWTNGYELNATGTTGLVGEAYKNLYTPCLEAEAVFEAGEEGSGEFYKRATAATLDTDLYYISSNDPVYVVTAYVGDRYIAVPDGGFQDALGNVYDFEETIPTVNDYWTNIVESYGKADPGNAGTGIQYESAGATFVDLVKEEFIKLEGPNGMTGGAISKVSGIQKTGAYTMRVEMTKFDATAIYQLGISVTPLHYYGSRANYKYTENKFGFTKGDLSSVRAKTTSPMGAGPYKYVEFEQGVVAFERNGLYFKGCPKITNIQFKETADADKIPGTVGTTFDVTDPSFNLTAAAAIEAENSNSELTGNIITTSLVDNLGYGYIGINADNVKVGTDKDSEASKNLRRALATVLAVLREPAINSYYGAQASVINYPISNTSWAAPQPADEGYALAYSLDINGDPIYTAGMEQAQREDAAVAAAVEFLTAAGYTFAGGVATAAPEGASLTYEIIVPGEGTGDHPAFAIITAAEALFAEIGITLDINDPANSNELWTAIESGVQEMWAAAWGATIDPDMYQVYHSSNVVGGGGTESNHYGIQDDELDELILAARESADTAYRKGVYKECLDIILDWAVEVPTYQRKNAVIFSTVRVDMASVTPDITTFWGWMNDIEELEMN
ncbi:MAG: Oligopeptide-binding protein AppA precursor [Firmicutes bacterium ADurb.Bin080]|nr:MAG: Oligopeptide-binding protein AppA precursor [Firmicutes bacterium ADurb.Bin080]